MKTAVVTGCSSGIGLATAVELLRNQYIVYGISRTAPPLSDPNFHWLSIDLTNASAIQECFKVFSENVVDVLINAAGIAFKVPGIGPDKGDFHRIFDLNLLAPVYVFSALKNRLSGGLIINVSSTSDRIPEKGYALYCSSKAALNMYFDVLALEQRDIKIINVLPDYVDTPLLRKEVGPEPFDWSFAVKPDQVAECMEFIIHHCGEYASGTRIMILNNKTLDSFTRKENLFAYNVDTKECIDRQ